MAVGECVQGALRGAFGLGMQKQVMPALQVSMAVLQR